MAKLSAEVDIKASVEDILGVLADMPQYPLWSSVHKRATVDQDHPDGRPQRATMAVSAVGLIDEQVLDYVWNDRGVAWTLVKAGQQSSQVGSYVITDGPDGSSHVRYDLEINPSIPMPGIIVRQVMKKAVTAATQGLKKRVESLNESTGSA